MANFVTLVGGPFAGMQETVDVGCNALDMSQADIYYRYRRIDANAFVFDGAYPNPFLDLAFCAKYLALHPIVGE